MRSVYSFSQSYNNEIHNIANLSSDLAIISKEYRCDEITESLYGVALLSFKQRSITIKNKLKQSKIDIMSIPLIIKLLLKWKNSIDLIDDNIKKLNETELKIDFLIKLYNSNKS